MREIQFAAPLSLVSIVCQHEDEIIFEDDFSFNFFSQ